ncbi:MAG: heme o synthase [Thermaerobacter sp.]|nr:heme o synthase [Thermaerobacter sp.]
MGRDTSTLEVLPPEVPAIRGDRTRPSRQGVLSDYLALTKPGIVIWLLITAYCAMVVARRGIPDLALTVWTLSGLGLSAGGAHAVNMWYDQDIDRVMERTKRRPVASGRITGRNALTFGMVAGVGSFVLLGVAVNWLAAASCLAGYVFYIVVYTMWLKRRTPQNIVIGGAAGAFPPIVGWAAATGHVGFTAWLMFLLIFMWTPPHFWALALYKQEDYRRANIPMMPIVRGARATKMQSLVYSVLVLAVSLLIYQTGNVGPVYLVVAVSLGLAFIGYNVALVKEKANPDKWAKSTFQFSLLYIVALFVAMVV